MMGFLLQVAILMSLLALSTGGGASAGDDGSRARQLLWGMLGASAIIYLVTCKLLASGKRFSFGGWPLIAMLAYICISTAWSITPSSTIKRAILLIFLVAVCAVAVGSWNRDWRADKFSKLLASPMACLLFLSILITAIMPSKAFTEIGWRGIMSHKNEAGQMMAFITLLLLYGVCHEKLSRKLRAVLVIVAVIGLLLAKSTTALLALIIGVGITELLLIKSTVNRLNTWQVAFVGVLLMASTLLFFAFQLELLPSLNTMYLELLAALGKSDTFTGRTAIWDLVLGESRFHNPLIGGGYGGFWIGRDSVSGYVLVGDGLYPGQAHNGYIDIYNDLGIVGLCILGAVIVAALYRAWRLISLNHPEAKIHLAITLMCIFLNLGESTFLRNTTFMNIVFLASFIRAASIVRQARAEMKSEESVGLMLPRV